ncbi:hypothetical protein [Streptomyces sp. NPDC020747]|uniref:hypothetical protein n=1 Tax=Streptomyces sp. NPDC020747 TaxID=3365086 RepID=UPI0037940D5C
MSTPTPPSASPLVELLDSNVTEVHVLPAFGNRLQVVFHTGEGMPEPMKGAVASVTVYGDGRISYEPLPQTEALS